ncbi:unnamed protein product [Brassica rapa]|uniref:Myb/SANT-like domain-containing protein n=1 Tax=Brassica campestris TaxID=3711 RepID=A0A8D9I536_BRACM|nr:unnamed protein product [Brassica rapa]
MCFMGLSSCECFQTWFGHLGLYYLFRFGHKSQQDKTRRMADDKWTDEEVRYFFALYADEKKKGNRPRSGMNLAGREFIINKFEEKFGKRWIWDRFKNKVDISRKAYVKFKKLTHNRTGLVYDALGRLEMPDAWWDQRIAVSIFLLVFSVLEFSFCI